MFEITLKDPLGVTYKIQSKAKKQDESARFIIKSNGIAGTAAQLRDQMVGSYGAFGHRIGQLTSPEDLHAYAMDLRQQGWDVEVTQGNIGTYVAPPKGAVF